ncbi:hypothetical protein F7D01_10850 [Erythrobacter sp. 3-20A1M]|uniref:flavin reductase family protein n=1 Tax=Erythrobacter sp. 3-20A1M TaxID=2653850 RepID=UPI001BFCBBEE|nr:flavin reductase family protein [Erythrobacter sp. 3-20A1M]QWC57506.1 hypothetical protein F7D01_10850 [Erythrobacter sp. 3-20A1M]
MTAAISATPDVRTAFLESMARLASAVHIVTAHSGGRDYGMTATAAMSLSTEPLSILISIHRDASAHDAIVSGGRICLNTLRPDQAELARIFSGMIELDGRSRFDFGEWQLGAGQPAQLRGAVSCLECAVLESHPIGTHRVFACGVTSVSLGEEARSLVYGNRRFGVMENEER